MTDERVMRWAEIERLGLTKKELYDAVSRGELPRPQTVGVRLVGWSRSAVNSYLRRKVK